MRCTLVILVVTISIVYAAQWSPMITFISPDQTKKLGEQTEFKCSVRDEGLSSVLWLKAYKGMDNLSISTGTTLVTSNPRITVRHDESNSTYILEIKDIQESDAGMYRCLIVLSVKRTIVGEINLQVQLPLM